MSWVIFDFLERIRLYSQKQELKLAEAIVANDIDGMRQLLEQRVDPNVKIVGNASEPIIFLIFQKIWFTLPSGSMSDRPKTLYKITAREECLRLLLEWGVNPNVRDSFGRTALELAILWCMPHIVKLLLTHGADPNLKDPNDITPLMKTVILGIQDARPMTDKLQIIMHLIDNGAEVNAQASDGKTALMYATGKTRMEIVELLINSGASLSITDNQSNQAQDLISRSISEQQKTYLQQILTQPQLNLLKYQHQKFILGEERLLEPDLSKDEE
ncbi:ankyrin repeat domain-containing protein [Pleurocapsa sp. PCC 7319]|uniref:ankyrin repeat domain-containing protein n=1 Tax=Pleurocapsa sp. PCC 7319 TaxID=118161 RepID=UPI0003484AC6|nr:ankyrin repeat domain-containing protein [Pleurocapsa sp. PCC 7319]